MLIDLRSDTVTQPNATMRNAMANAEVGDDVYGDDATVNALDLISAGPITRMITHLNISRTDLEKVVALWREFLSEQRS